MPKRVKFPTIHFKVEKYRTRCGLTTDNNKGTWKVPRVTCKNCLTKLGIKAIKTSIKAAKARVKLEFSDGSTRFHVLGGSESFEFRFENNIEVVPLEKLRDRGMKDKGLPIRFGFEEKPIEIELVADSEFTENLRKAVFGEPFPLRNRSEKDA